MKKIVILLLFVISFVLCAEEKTVFEAKSISDWGGAVRKTTFHDGVFDTGMDQFVVISKQPIKIQPGKEYTLSGDFKLKPYAPFSNIYFGLDVYDAAGKGIKRLYIGKSPYNDRVAPGNNQQVRNFWLTFSGSIKSEAFPKNAAFFKVIIHQFENYIVDMYFKNIKVTEK
jgi:hypothetical protein